MKTLPSSRRWPLTLLLLAAPFFAAQACGPGFRPDIFVRPLNPDNHAAFGEGSLSLLQPTYLRWDLIVAYRYLSGGKLSEEELASYKGPPSTVLTETQMRESAAREQTAMPINRWIAERTRYPNPPQTKPVEVWDTSLQMREFPNPSGQWRYGGDFLNCPGAAFETAVLTLRSRAKTFGSPNPALSDWISGQDAVFSNCNGKAPAMPAAVPTPSPALLRADREYQIAAANFYAGEFDTAVQQFDMIAKDTASPWQEYGGYLAARALIRKSSLAKIEPSDNNAATFEPGPLLEAQYRLEALLRDPAQAKMHHAVLAELNFVLLRTQTEKRLQAIAAALAGPKADPDFHQDLIDLTFVLDQRLDQTGLREDFQTNSASPDTPSQHTQAYLQAADLRKDSPLSDWLLTFQSPCEDAHQHALQLWNQTRTLPWLTAAIAKSTAKDATTLQLLEAAAKVPATSPAYVTVTFHRARLLIALDRRDEARALLDAVLPGIRKAGSESASNAFLGLRMQTARTLAEFLTYAPRKLLEMNSQAAGTASCFGEAGSAREASCKARRELPDFDLDAASAINFRFPMELLIATAKSPELPENLRQAVAISAWVRSVLLEDAAAAAQLAPLLPKTVEQTAASSVDFPATLAMLRNPGMQPYLGAGVQRALAYNVLDNYRDNWWCPDWSKTWSSGGAYGTPAPAPAPAVAVPFLPETERSAAEAQAQRLTSMKESGSIYLGRRALAYAKAHPDDPAVPEALALTVRATHFGCSTQDLEAQRLETAKDAFQLLHRRYPSSTWAKKAKIYS